jgi:hypothetical protein
MLRQVIRPGGSGNGANDGRVGNDELAEELSPVTAKVRPDIGKQVAPPLENVLLARFLADLRRIRPINRQPGNFGYVPPLKNYLFSAS